MCGDGLYITVKFYNAPRSPKSQLEEGAQEGQDLLAICQVYPQNRHQRMGHQNQMRPSV